MSELFGGSGGGGGDVAAHEAAADPHGGYLLESDPAVVKTGQANTYSTGAQSFAAATSLLVPAAAAYAPTADGSIGYATTQDRYVAGGAGGLTGSFPRVLSVTAPNETLTNSTTSAQVFTSIFTIPGNYLIAGRVLRVTLFIQSVTDASASTLVHRLLLGSTAVAATAAITPANSATRSVAFSYLIFGTAPPGASVNVNATIAGQPLINTNGGYSGTTLPVALATNGALDIIPGVTFNTNTGGESLAILHAMVEELN